MQVSGGSLYVWVGPRGTFLLAAGGASVAMLLVILAELTIRYVHWQISCAKWVT